MGYGKIICKVENIVNDVVQKLDYVIDLDLIHTWAVEGEKIKLIKEYRMITKAGLKDSKDAVEDAIYRGGPDEVVNIFKKAAGYLFDPYTKEEFLHLIENAIDNMEHLQYDDMIAATLALLTNVRQRGGLERLAKERQNFLENI